MPLSAGNRNWKYDTCVFMIAQLYTHTTPLFVWGVSVLTYMHKNVHTLIQQFRLSHLSTK